MEKIEDLKLLTTSAAAFSNWNGDPYTNDIVRSAIDTLARLCSKLKGTHYIEDSNGRHEKNCKLNSLLQIEPNPYMNAVDFLYKVSTHYFLHNNSFIFIDRGDNRQINGLYPIDCVSVNFLEDDKNNIYIAFRLKNGNEVYFSSKDIIHLRRHYNSDLLIGDSNLPISNTILLAQRQNEGLINQIENSATIRGIVNVSQILSPEKLKAYSDSFKENYLDVKNDGGVIVTDTSMEFVPVTMTPININKDQIEAVRDKIYSYFGINEKIVTGNYNEDEWNAFYESVIEPYSLQLSKEFTRKIFTERERLFGNEILFNTDNMFVASMRNKTTMIRTLAQIGVLTKNEIREMFGFNPLEDDEGNKIIQSLNNINSESADEYQLNKTE